MKKTLLLLLLILFTLTSLYADKVERDKNDHLQNLKIGDKFTISKTTTDNETTFDFTGLGIDDSNTWLNINMQVNYIVNSGEYIDLSISVDDTTNLLNWDLTYPRPDDAKYSVYMRAILNSFSKQSFKIPKSFTINNEKTMATTISISYMPYGWVSDIKFIYYLKSTTSNPYELEVVGIEIINFEDNQTIIEGDSF